MTSNDHHGHHTNTIPSTPPDAQWQWRVLMWGAHHARTLMWGVLAARGPKGVNTSTTPLHQTSYGKWRTLMWGVRHARALMWRVLAAREQMVPGLWFQQDLNDEGPILKWLPFKHHDEPSPLLNTTALVISATFNSSQADDECVFTLKWVETLKLNDTHEVGF